MIDSSTSTPELLLPDDELFESVPFAADESLAAPDEFVAFAESGEDALAEPASPEALAAPLSPEVALAEPLSPEVALLDAP